MNTVKTVDVYSCREILRIRAGIDQGTAPDEPGEYYWFELLRGCAESDALEAAWAHYRAVARSLWPSDILDRVSAMEAVRRSAFDAVRRRLLTDRALRGWDPELLARWNTAFETEVGRGAHPDDAEGVADVSVSPAGLRAAPGGRASTADRAVLTR